MTFEHHFQTDFRAVDLDVKQKWVWPKPLPVETPQDTGNKPRE